MRLVIDALELHVIVDQIRSHGSEQVSKFLADVWGTGDIHLGAEVNDNKALNAWLRGHGVEVGGGFRPGDELEFPDKLLPEIVLEIP